ncbi:vWA domain-containing protein [Humisphaera borealis]|uniref:VWA domain-containing protein n=1 Tax=Humisphaera borealis TaxID=2807512 RepID=A0A7M2WWE2_9BACT|nr:vWA domain-containing protein [Humisphaera borealis]QOV89522.1 VWA domain-containing protein [Humisphaera borealis]
MNESRLTFDTPWPMLIALIIAATTVAIAWRRRLALPKASLVLATLGLALVVLSAGMPNWRRPAAGEVAVMVDLSPSTRSAGFRDRATVEKRAKELLGTIPFRIYRFGDGAAVIDDGSTWAELPVPFTRYEPPAADAVLLFSDGRFDPPPSAPPTYAVIDATLAKATDGRVATLTIDGGDAVATVAVDAARSMSWVAGATNPPPIALTPGRVVLRRPIASTANGSVDEGVAPAAARLSPGDLWPENDALSIIPPPPQRRDRWFVSSSSAAPAGYRLVAPADLPVDASAYLSASTIVLDNLPAAAISAVAQERLTQFVRDLGGGLLIVGGDRSFAAGGYVGTAIESLSPLASVPPRPTTEWILLTDGSGSMNTGDGTRTRWQLATAALVRLLPSLPPQDPTTLGHFAADVTWWMTARPAKEVATLSLPPSGISPGGPTNLRPAIEAAARRHDPAMPGQLLLLSDADAEVGNVAELVALLKSRKVKLHVLAVGDGKGLADLRQVVEQTGGSIVQQTDASRWADAAADLLKSAGEKHLATSPVDVRYSDRLATLTGRRVAPSNRTWLKPQATLLGSITDPLAVASAEPTPAAAIWQVGEGKAAAAGFVANDTERAALANLVAAAPRDPRIAVTVTPGGRLRVRIDAIDAQADSAKRYLNGLSLKLTFSAEGAAPVTAGDSARASARPVSIPQTAPGRYEVEIDAPARPTIATILNGDAAVDRFAVAGRYAREFDEVGIDRDSLNRLVDRFGGAVIEPDQATPIDFKWPLRVTSIAPLLAGLAAVMLVLALLWWRWA